MKKVTLTLLMLFLSCPILAQETQYSPTTKTGKPVKLQRKIPPSETQPPEIDDKIQKPEDKAEKQPPSTEELTPKTTKPKSNKPKYPGLIIYDKPEDEPCDNCYYYYEKEFKAGKYRKNTYYDRKAMTKEEKVEKEKKIMKGGGGGRLFHSKGLKHRGKKICK